MTSEHPIPPNVMQTAEQAAKRFCDMIDNGDDFELADLIADAIMQDRAARVGNHVGLTLRQRVALDFIAAYSSQNGCSPSTNDMRKAFGLASNSGVHRLVISLEERGCIRRLPNRAHSLSIIERTV